MNIFSLVRILQRTVTNDYLFNVYSSHSIDCKIVARVRKYVKATMGGKEGGPGKGLEICGPQHPTRGDRFTMCWCWMCI